MLIQGDTLVELKKLPSKIIQCCVTSPPYWQQRDYGHIGQLGQEELPEQYINAIVKIGMQIYRVLRDDGIFWLNIGDSHLQRDFGVFKKGNLAGIPWLVAFRLQQLGWHLIQDIIWHKTNAMPQPVTKRCVSAHEYIFMFTKSLDYYFDHSAIQTQSIGDTHNRLFGGNKYRDGGTYSGNAYTDTGKANKRDVWPMASAGYKGSHCAPFPEELPKTCILASTKEGDTVLDPFIGSGTTAVVAQSLGRKWIGIDLDTTEAESRIHGLL